MPVDRGAIDAQLREIGEGERWWEQREFRELPHVLYSDERILGLANGKLLGARRPRLRSPQWLLVVTNARLLCLHQQRFARRQIDIPAGQVTRLNHRVGLTSYHISLHAQGRRYRIRLRKDDAFRFMAALGPNVQGRTASRLPADLEPLSWIPGINTVAGLPGVSGLIEKVSMLSPPDYATRAHVERLEAAVEQLREDLDRAQQRVAFLEDLLEKRAEASFLQSSGSS